MNDQKQPVTPGLRERAELKHAEMPALGKNPSIETMQRIVQELQIHQIELEMQNEELRQAQLQLSAVKDEYADLYDFAPMAYLTLDKKGNIAAANLAAAAMLGPSKVELLKANISRFVDSESQDIMYFHLQHIYTGDTDKQKESCDLTIDKLNGEKITVHIESLRYGREDTALCRTALFDISEQRLQSEALQASEKRYQRISRAVSDYIYHVPYEDGHKGRVVPDTGSEEITGYSTDELLAMDYPAKTLTHPEDWPTVEGERDKLVAGVDVSSAEVRIVTKGGDVRWVSNILAAQRDEHGKLIGYDGILQDITNRKVAQLQLEALNAELGESLDSRTSQLQETTETVKLMATAMTNLLEGVIIMQRSGEGDDYCVVFANRAIARMIDYESEELIGKTLLELKTGGLIPGSLTASEYAAAAIEAGDFPQLQNLRLPTGNRGYCDTEIRTSPIYDVNKQLSHLVLIYRDVTLRKEAELELYQRDEHLKAILNTVADAIFTIDIEGHIRDVNPVARSLFGYTSQELLGSNIAILFPGIVTSGSDMTPIVAIANKISNRIGGNANAYREYTAKRKNGSSIPVGLGIREIDRSGLFTCVIRDLSLVKSMQRQILDIVEEENRRIGRELHDSIQQQLIGTRLLADNIFSNAQALPQVVCQAQARFIEALDNTIDDLRTLCHGMVAIHLDGDGLRAALNQLATGVADSSNIKCSFESVGKVILTDTAVAAHIYRIAQEAVTNALKYANAGNITISLRAETGQLTLKVCDDGIGIQDENIEEGGMGLQIMRYRVGLTSGNLEIYSPETGGTCLICSVPMSPPQVEHAQGSP